MFNALAQRRSKYAFFLIFDCVHSQIHTSLPVIKSFFSHLFVRIVNIVQQLLQYRTETFRSNSLAHSAFFFRVYLLCAYDAEPHQEWIT